MVVIVFSTLLYVRVLLSLFLAWLIVIVSRYFIERGTWDETLEVFLNSDGDPSQFAVSSFYYTILCPTCLSNRMHPSPYLLQHGT